MKNVYDYLISRYGRKDESFSLVEQLCERVRVLEEKYNGSLHDIRRLEEENIETSNILYQIMNSVDAVDARIDILISEKWLKEKDV